MRITGLLFASALAVLAQGKQNPSPMVEHTRPHPRLEKTIPEGRREKLSQGTLYLPAKLKLKNSGTPLVVFFHGGTWIPEVAASRSGPTAVIWVQANGGSSAFAKLFENPAVFGSLLKEAESKADTRFDPITLAGWSAGVGAIRQILQSPNWYTLVERVLIIDGMHTDYATGKPGPVESKLVPGKLEAFVRFARDAVQGSKEMIVTHSEIFPGTFASTTETADYLIGQLGLTRTPVLKWGPQKTQQLSEVRAGRFVLAGYAGNSAPDHVDQLHSLPEYLDWFK